MTHDKKLLERMTLRTYARPLLLLACPVQFTAAFTSHVQPSSSRLGLSSSLPPRSSPLVVRAVPPNDTAESSGGEVDAKDEAERLFAKARAIRESLPTESETTPPASSDSDAASSATTQTGENDPKLSSSSGSALGVSSGVGYRLYVDIGREDGTWMEPRWGASGSRIEFTVDVSFLTPDGTGDNSEDDASLAAKDVRNRMVKDNFGGRSSAVRIVEATSPNARLRSGFDKMACRGGGYRIDVSGTDAVVRFHLDVDGTPTSGPGSTYGDICVPKGDRKSVV